MAQLEVNIAGMHCEACVARIRDQLASESGVAEAHVALGRARIEFDPSDCEVKRILDAVRRTGFTVVGFKRS